jgi:hypothetical protein
MKKALISPLEARETGYRIADVEQEEFEVASPMFWKECPDDVTQDTHWYDPSDETFKELPHVEQAKATQDIASILQTLLT